MKDRHFTLPEKKGYDQAYELAYKLACEQLLKVGDIEEQCRKSGAQYRVVESEKAIVVKFLNQPYIITLPDVEVSLEGSAEEVPIREKLLILHYFNSAKGTPAANSLITFRELPEGGVYYPTFTKRTIEPILRYFGKETQLLVGAGEKLGGHRVDYGDTAVTINAFSHVPVTIIIWRGDSEFAPRGSVVFDATISDYLPTEDITVLCETITWRLIRHLRENQ